MKLTANQCVELLGISRATLYRKLKTGALKALDVKSLIEYSYQQGYKQGLAAGQEKMYQQLDELGKIRRRKTKTRP